MPKPANSAMNVSAATSLPASTHTMAISEATRLPALDFTKGTLVLTMVFYHWLNYFVEADVFYYRYLRFLTPSFILITGFLISHVSFAKYTTTDLRLSLRLFQRGLKLLAIFIGCNIVIHLSFGVSKSRCFYDWARVLSGNSADERATFFVLLPISGLLLVSALLLVAARVYRYVFHVACALCIAAALISKWNGANNTVIELLGIGFLGVSCGYIPTSRINALVRHAPLLLLAYCGYLGALTWWAEVYLLQIAGVSITVAMIYVVGTRGDGQNRVRRTTILLGRYSLFGYVMQIIVLQLLRKGLYGPGVGISRAGAALFAGSALTVICVQGMEWARTRTPTVDRLYSAIFA